MYLPNIYDQQLLNRLRFRMTKRNAVELAQAYYDSGIEPDAIMALCLHPNASVSFHAAWVLELMIAPQPALIDHHLNRLVDQLPQLTNQSAIRHTTKLISIGLQRIIGNKTPKEQSKLFWQQNLDPLEDTCFYLLTDDCTKPGVKVHCMDILCSLSNRAQWIAEQLPDVIQSQMKLGSPAIWAKGRELMKRMSIDNTNS